MAEFIVDLLFPLTVMLAILLISHAWVMRHLGANGVYRIWLLVPIGLLIYGLPSPVASQLSGVNTEVIRYVVKPTSNITENVTQYWLLSFWVTSSSLLVFYWFVNHFRFLMQLSLVPLSKHHLTNVTRQNTLPQSLAIYQSEKAYSPMLVGIIKPKLVLPHDFKELYNDEQQQLIIQHEICHFDRNDIYWNLLAHAMLALFWFHPLVWLAYSRYRRDQELSCDQLVLARKQLNSRINYSKALLVAAETAPPYAFAQLSFKKYGDKGIMFERIKQIQTTSKASTLSVSLATVLSISVLSGLSYAGSIDEQKQQHRTPPKAVEVVKPVHRVPPAYPEKAAHENIEGAVVMKFDVTPSGSVENIEVMTGEPAYVFDSAAIAALKQWKYDAKGQYHKNQLVQLDFRLNESSTFNSENLIERVKITK
ncbi:M56 family metallopeptidase [Thalassotalea sediminis]|uniref:M56 family metallopeptidase n=1 Tax=Thalassotalea sediminis TaxID=1759089 RepID=UPI0025743C91|nr:M56 family metallopeptidase [Thalassotalea sediminis]